MGRRAYARSDAAREPYDARVRLIEYLDESGQLRLGLDPAYIPDRCRRGHPIVLESWRDCGTCGLGVGTWECEAQACPGVVWDPDHEHGLTAQQQPSWVTRLDGTVERSR